MYDVVTSSVTVLRAAVVKKVGYVRWNLKWNPEKM